MTEGTGRTGWDFATETLRSSAAIPFVCVILVVPPLVVHLQAEPGTEVSLYVGLIKYQKAKPMPPLLLSAPANLRVSEWSSLPEEMTLEFGTPVAILDRALNVTAMRHPHLGGANMELVSLAARSPRGEPLGLRVNRGQYIEVENGLNSYIEMGYKSHYFALLLTTQQSAPHLRVSEISVPTMRLRGYAELAMAWP